MYNGCLKEILSKADRFIIHFPEEANYNSKLLLVYAAILIDFD